MNFINSQVFWKEIEKWKNTKKNIWKINGKVVGAIKKFKNLTFVTVYKAGHMVPSNQPIIAKEIVKNFINKDHNF